MPLNMAVVGEFSIFEGGICGTSLRTTVFNYEAKSLAFNKTTRFSTNVR